MMQRFHYVVPALLPLLLVSGCASDSWREKQTRVCADLAALNRAIEVLRTIRESSTIETLKQSEEQVGEDFRRLKAALQEIQGVPLNDLETAYQDLETSVDAIPDRATLKQAIATIADKVTKFDAALTQAQSRLNCPSY